MTKDEALDLALEWFKCYQDQSMSRNNAEALADEVVTAIKQALEAPVQEPVAWMDADGDVYKSEPHPNWCPPHVPLCIIPPQRKPPTA
jgi:hypothetical protein